MIIYIIRHGQTEMNIRKVLQGRSNYPLNEEGIAQAQKAADELRHITFTKSIYKSAETGHSDGCDHCAVCTRCGR